MSSGENTRMDSGPLRKKKTPIKSFNSLTNSLLSLYFYAVRCSFVIFHFNLSLCWTNICSNNNNSPSAETLFGLNGT